MGPTLHYLLKVLITAVLVVSIAEVGKRSTLWAAVLASLPLTSVLAFVWMHLDGQTNRQVAELASGIPWLVLPSLLLFWVLDWALRAKAGPFGSPWG